MADISIRDIFAFSNAMQENIDSRRCINCSFWQREGRMGKCNCNKFFYDCGEGYDDEHREDGLAFCDAECYNAWVTTGPQFGCVHFNRKG